MSRPDSVLDSRALGHNQATWLRGVGTEVFVPENFEPSYRYPVVVWLEGSNSGFEARTWFPLISPRNVVAISPDDLWGALEYVGESVAEVAAEVVVHPRRIFLAGREDGAAMAADILYTEPERFAGAILIDPTVDATPASVDWKRDRPPSQVLVATKHDEEILKLQDRYGDQLEIESASEFSKPALARSINHWLMAQIDTASSNA